MYSHIKDSQYLYMDTCEILVVSFPGACLLNGALSQSAQLGNEVLYPLKILHVVRCSIFHRHTLNKVSRRPQQFHIRGCLVRQRITENVEE